MTKEKLRSLREHLMLSQKEFSEEVGISYSQYTKVESGQVYPSNKLIQKIINRFGINADYFSSNAELRISHVKKQETKVLESPWKEEAYSLLKKELEYWRAIAMKLAGAELGKAKTLVYSGYLAANTSKSRKGVN